MTYKVIKGIPIPKRSMPTKHSKYPFEDLKDIGDHFFVPLSDLDTSHPTFVTKMHKDATRRFGIKVSVIKTAEKINGKMVEGVGVWRIKFKKNKKKVK